MVYAFVFPFIQTREIWKIIEFVLSYIIIYKYLLKVYLINVSKFCLVIVVMDGRLGPEP